MATVLGLALKISADASGVQKALTPVQRAFQQLDAEAAKVTDAFKAFDGVSAGASAAQQKFATDLAFLQSALRTGQIGAKEYADQFALIQKEATATSAAFEEGLRITEANRTAEEKRANELNRLNDLLELGAISQETFNRASAEASGANAEAAKAAKEAADLQAAADKQRADDSTRASEIIKANLTKEQRAQEDFKQSTAELDRLRAAGLLTEKDYSLALDRVARDYAKATLAADKFAGSASKSGDAGTLKFNELSGVLSAIPGPIGNVAGRLSGLASAGEGLGKVFAGGLSQSLGGLGSTLIGLANPFTIALAGFAGLGAAASAVASGLSDLEAETERLTNSAEKLGVSFGFIQTLEQAAKMAGIEFGSVNSAMTKLLKTLAGADEESKQATAALGRLGVSLNDLDGLDTESQIRLIGERLQGIEDPAKRAAAATAIFGKSGAELLPFFNNLEIAEQTLTRFNAKLSDIDASRVLALGDSFDGVQASITGLGRELLTPFIGLAQSIADSLAPAIASFGRVLGNILDIISPLLSTFGVLINVIGQVVGVLLNAVSVAIEPFAFAARNLGQSIDSISQQITKAFGPITDLFVSISGVFGITFASVDKTASKTTASVENMAAASKKAADEQKKAFEELQKAIESGGKALDGAIAKAGEFGQAGFDAAYQFQQALADLQDQANEGELNADQYARGVANATAEYEKQIAAIKKVTEETKKAADEAAKKAEDDKKRLDQLLNPNESASKIQKDIAFVIEQQAAAEKELAAARAASDKQAADSAAARLAQLDGLRVKLETQSQAIDQGFADGFSAAFAKTDESLSGLIDRAAQFGNAGAEAAMKLQEGVAAAQEQASAGIIPKEVYEREIANQKKVFDDRIAQIEKVRAAEQAARNEVFNQQVAANDRVTQLVLQRSAAEADAADQVAARRQQAAFNVEAIEQRIALERQSLEAAREQNDGNAAKAAVQRIELLKDALTVEQQIADGRRQDLQTQKQLISSQQQFQQQQVDAAQRQQQSQQAYAQEQARIFEEQQKSAAAEAKRQEDRLRKLNTLGSTTIQATDIRTQQGAALVVDLAANAQDPALIQARLQTKLLEQVALGIGKAASNYFNAPVAIVGAARLG